MPQRLCHRCQAVLHVEDEGTLVYCSVCGAPQVTLSEELQELAAAQRADFDSAATTAAAGPGSLVEVPDLQVLWRPMIAIAASVAAGLSVVAAWTPAFAIMAWVAPMVVLTIYSTRHRHSRITGGVGARVGLVSGVFSGFGICSAAAFRLIVLHRSASLAAQMDASVVQAKARMAAQAGPGAPDLVGPLFSQPEFRAGMLLAMFAFCVMVLVMLSTASGAASGFVFSRFERR